MAVRNEMKEANTVCIHVTLEVLERVSLEFPSSEFHAVMNITFHRLLKILFKVTCALPNQSKFVF